MNGLMLVRISAKATPTFLQEVRAVKGVVDAYAVFGRFDVVVLIEGEDFQKVKAVAADITKLKGIKSTETLIEGR